MQAPADQCETIGGVLKEEGRWMSSW